MVRSANIQRELFVDVTPITGHHVGELPIIHTPRTPPPRNPSLPGVYGMGIGLISLSVSWIYTLCSGLAKSQVPDAALDHPPQMPPATSSRRRPQPRWRW